MPTTQQQPAVKVNEPDEELEALVKEARQRAFRRRAGVATVFAGLAIVAYALLSGGGGDENGRSASPDAVAPSTLGYEVGARSVSCEVGEPPPYFVPGREGGLIVGCARLATSGRHMTFSVDAEQIGQDGFSCVNPAYRGRGQRAMYIPASCFRRVGGGIRPIQSGVPTQGVHGYGRVIWGVAPASHDRLRVETEDVAGAAAVFEVKDELRAASGAGRDFNLFVAEFPEFVKCETVRIAPKTASEVGGCR